MVSATFSLHTVSEANRREHWAKKARRAKDQRNVTAMVLRSKAIITGAALDRFHHVVKITRIAPRKLDTDNLARAMKACRDGVADWLGIDDADTRVTWEYGQERGGVREYAVRVEVRPR